MCPYLMNEPLKSAPEGDIGEYVESAAVLLKLMIWCAVPFVNSIGIMK
jgi:hypothetical protein